MNFTHPFERIGPGHIRRYAVPLFLLDVAVGVPLLANVEAGPGLRSLAALALAGSPAAAAAVLATWTSTDRIHIAFANGLDYLWGFLYANSMALACVWAGRLSDSRRWTTTASLLAWLSWVVAVLDVPENVSYYQMVRGVNRSPYPEMLASLVVTRTLIFVVFLAFLAVALSRRVGLTSGWSGPAGSRATSRDRRVAAGRSTAGR
jgi:hypothetical protein